MRAKRGVKKNHFTDADRLRGSPHRDYRDRKERRAAEMAINAFGTSMGQVRGLIRHIHKLTLIPEMTLWRWQEIIGEDPDWWPWQTHHGGHRRIFSRLVAP
jgi:hypothetical protein